MLSRFKFYSNLFFFIFIFDLNYLIAKSGYNTNSTNYSTAEIPPLIIPELALVPINGWDQLVLGLDFSKLRKLLIKKYPWLILTTEIDSEMPDENDTSHVDFYRNNYFDEFSLQFNQKKKLYLIRIKLSKNIFSFNKIYETLKKKYGQSQVVTSSYVRWQRKDRKLTLNRDLTLVYFASNQIPLSKEYIEDPGTKLTKENKDFILNNL